MQLCVPSCLGKSRQGQGRCEVGHLAKVNEAEAHSRAPCVRRRPPVGRRDRLHRVPAG